MPAAQPSWYYEACRVLDRAADQHCRITAFHLTTQQAADLKVFTGTDERCLGYPVHIWDQTRETKH